MQASLIAYFLKKTQSSIVTLTETSFSQKMLHIVADQWFQMIYLEESIWDVLSFLYAPIPNVCVFAGMLITDLFLI